MAAIDLLDDALDPWTACEARACREYAARQLPPWWWLRYLLFVAWTRRPRGKGACSPSLPRGTKEVR